MEHRFQGESLNKVDGKGRVSIPVKFRRVLQNSDKQYTPGGAPRLYIAYGNAKDRHLECLSGDAFDEIDAIIRAEKRGSHLRRGLEYLYYSKCDETSVDDTGRLVLSALARDKIGLGAEALFQGKGDKFHILNSADGAAADEDIEAMLAALGQGNDFFDPLSLAGQTGPKRSDDGDA
ncbi:cell division/cell wall cluster transcriptional repressor MraZ [Rhodophyticola sp. CCM32]|uniref:division/cell wall cluster transcriptional repressor MraZ n=1 Tax=Rhodophyticola sp. CCM32 TaxID=2916397 RepID=UPI00107F5A55|nr:cell division/cell wall cluster transcriptional repressor MraZ [Rhodophyticola sp. CCM32]QBY00962.1 cell division/cell wall cluster transcriptional repressor MraZ [Rhodophyticola sp. CCM32]